MLTTANPKSKTWPERSERLQNPKSGDLPNLLILPVADLVPHEQADPRRVERLSARLRHGGLLKNPIITAPIPGTACAGVLDGGNRTWAFQAVRLHNAIAQLVDYHG